MSCQNIIFKKELCHEMFMGNDINYCAHPGFCENAL